MNTQDILEFARKNLEYRFDSISGSRQLFWRKSGSGRRTGQRAGCLLHGYIYIGLTLVSGEKQKLLPAHRIIWLIHNGIWPVDQIDHIDHNKLNNELSNLREVTPKDNQKNRPIQSNNKSGVPGIYWNKEKGKWRAQIHNPSGKNTHIGYFTDKSEAILARKSKEAEYGYHTNHGYQERE
jgi:hypothetical protein